MFARTERLTLRPPWPEDAPALAAAIGHEAIARMLMRVPHPFTPVDADAFVARQRGAEEPRFVVIAHDRPLSALIGGIAIQEEPDGHHLAYWLCPDAWGRGYATEAARAVVDMARHALPLTELRAWHFTDNPASGRVLRKLGFAPTGRTLIMPSMGRAEPAPGIEYDLHLDENRAPMPIAA